MPKVNNILIIGFSLLTILLLISAGILFFNHYGFGAAPLYMHYAGDEEAFIQAKSFSSILKSFSPHILVMPLVFFILFHLAIAAKLFSKRNIRYIGIIGFSATFGDIFITFLIPYAIFFAYAKMLFFFAFQLSLIVIIVGFFKKVFIL